MMKYATIVYIGLFALSLGISACGGEKKQPETNNKPDTSVKNDAASKLFNNNNATADSLAPDQALLGEWRQIDLRREDAMPLSRDKEQEFRQVRMNFQRVKDKFTLKFNADSTFEQSGLDLVTMNRPLKAHGNYFLEPNGKIIYYRVETAPKQYNDIQEFHVEFRGDTLITRSPMGVSSKLLRSWVKIKPKPKV